MKKNPYINNPVAQSILGSYNQMIFENEKVDDLLGKISDNALNIFKILTFDLAPKRDRNPDVMRVKLSNISDSKTVKQLVAKLLDYADDNDVSNSKFAEVKRLYLESLKKYSEALTRSVELSKEKEDYIIKRFTLGSMKLQNSIDFMAKEAEKEEQLKAKKVNESSDFYVSAINEGLFEGYRGRVKQLKRILTNLITSSEGKDQKGGYGRNWKQIFLDLEQKRMAIDISDEGLARKKDKENLEKLEKDVEKFQEEFNSALINASNRSMQQIESDDEIGDRFQDVSELTDQALVYQTKAKTQYLLAMQDIRDEKKESEDDIAKKLFPLKRGDTDEDSKLKGSGLIYAIQTAMSNGISAFKKLIKQKKGPNGKFGPATQSGVMAIQKLTGNKNANGQIDKTLLYNIMISDWVSEKDRKAIQDALDKIKGKVNESSRVNLMAMSDLYNPIYEEKIVIDQEEFSKELEKQYKSIEPIVSKGEEGTAKESQTSGTVEKLALKLRKNYSLKVESDDFKKVDGTLRSAYTPDFIKAWNLAVEEAEKKGLDQYSYFYFKGGVYNINVATSSLKTPCNIPSWSKAKSINVFSPEDSMDFLRNYLKGWRTFGLVRPEFRYDGIKKFYAEASEDFPSDLEKYYDMMNNSIKYKGSPFIEYDDLRSGIAKSFKAVGQVNSKSSDFGNRDLFALYDFFIMISSAVTVTEEGRVVSCLKWIHDNALGESQIDKFLGDISGMSFSGISFMSKAPKKALSISKSSITVANVNEYSSTKPKFDLELIPDSINGYKKLIKKIYEVGKSSRSWDTGPAALIATNLYRVFAEIYPSISAHVKRMNSTDFDNVPQKSPFKCLEIS